MFSKGRRPSDIESMSSQTTDVTSRATTIPDSPSDTTLTPQQEKSRINIQPREEANRSSTSATNTASVNTAISSHSNAQRAYNNQSNVGNQQQQPWVNPYWGPNAKSNAPELQSGVNSTQNNANNGYSSLFTGVPQLIPGSIIINDRGEIDNLSRKQNTNLNSTTSNNSSQFGGKFLSNDSNRPGGYLEPTHIQRRIVTSSPGVAAHPENQFGHKRSSSSDDAVNSFHPTFNRQQTFPQTTDHNIQPWVNPYWPKPNQTKTSQPSTDLKQITWNNPDSSTGTSVKPTSSNGTWTNPYWKDWKPQTSSSTKQEQQTWTNPYWKDWKPQTSTGSKPNDQTWKNPYWKDWKPQTSTPSQPKDQPWQNPYWKDSKPQTSTPSKPKDQPWENPYWKPQGSTTCSQQEDKSWQNPYWKDQNTSNQSTNGSALNRLLSFEHKVPPIPSFYERIYPSATPLSSPIPTIQQETQFSTETSKQNIDDNDDLPFTIDSQGTAHYRAIPASTSGTNKTVKFNSPPITSQYPVSPPNLSSAAPPSQKLFTTSSPKSVNTTSLFQTNYLAPPSHSSNITSSPPSNSANYPLSSTSSLPVITEADLNSIQHALQQLATNSSAITVVETPNQIPFANVSYQDNREQQSHQQYPLPSSNISYSNNVSSPLASLFAGHPGQQSQQQNLLPSSNISYSNNVSSPLASLFTGRPGQQSQQQNLPPSSNISYSNNVSSPLASLFTGRPGQQSQQQNLPPSSNISYSNNVSSPLASLFTGRPGQQSQQQNLLPSSNISYSNNVSSPLASLFTGRPGQQSQQQNLPPSSSPNIPINSPPYSYDSNAQKLTVFSTPSYPSPSDESSRRLIAQGSILLI